MAILVHGNFSTLKHNSLFITEFIKYLKAFLNKYVHDLRSLACENISPRSSRNPEISMATFIHFCDQITPLDYSKCAFQQIVKKKPTEKYKNII